MRSTSEFEKIEPPTINRPQAIRIIETFDSSFQSDERFCSDTIASSAHTFESKVSFKVSLATSGPQ